MGRSRASAKKAGSKHNRSVADYLKEHVSRFIDKAPSWGAADRGDVVNVETFNQLPVAVECKDYGGQIKAAEWLAEAEAERINHKAVAGVVAIKRRGTTKPGEQMVLMTMRDFVAILTGKRPEEDLKS